MSDERHHGRAVALERSSKEKPEKASIADVPTNRAPGIVLGRLVALAAPNLALVALKGCPTNPPLSARLIAGLTAADEGREVALVFEEGNPARPLVIGCIEDAPGVTATRNSKQAASIEAEKIFLTGEREIVLRCGESTLTLTRDGKLILRGAYVETQASGVNRIKGGCVKIN